MSILEIGEIEDTWLNEEAEILDASCFIEAIDEI